jgi:hypothetical protein
VKVHLSAPATTGSLIFAHVFWGAGYAFGPARLTVSGSLRVAMEWAPGRMWGWLFLAGAAATIAAPHLPRVASAVLHAAAAAPVAGFVVALSVAQAVGYSEGWGGVLAFVVAIVLHAVLVQARFSAEEAGRA